MAGCIAHARNGHISTSGLKSDVTIVFLDPDFLKNAKILAIRVHLMQIYDYLIFAWVSGPLGLKWGFWGQNRGRGGAILTPQQFRSYFWGFLRLCQFWWKSIKKCDRESAYRRTNTLTHTLTDANRFYNLSHAIGYSYCSSNPIEKNCHPSITDPGYLMKKKARSLVSKYSCTMWVTLSIAWLMLHVPMTTVSAETVTLLRVLKLTNIMQSRLMWRSVMSLRRRSGAPPSAG